MKNKTIFFDDWKSQLSGLALVRRETLRHINFPHKGRLLDVGCGTGKLLSLLKDLVETESHLHGVDVSWERIAAAQERLGEDPVLKVENVTDMCCLPEEFYDCVVSVLVIHHLPPKQKDEMIKEMVRVTKPGGTIVVTDVGFAENILGDFLWHLFWKNHAESYANLAYIVSGLEENCTVEIKNVQFGLFYHIVATKR